MTVEALGKGDDFRKMVIANLDSFVYEHFTNMIGQKVKLTDYQHDFVKQVLERKHNKYIMLSATRVGKTECNAILAVLMAILYDGEEVVNIAPRFKQADIMFKRIKGFIMNDARLRSFVDESRGFRRDEINLINNSVLRCLSASVEKEGESLLGFGATTLLIDEAGSIPDEIFNTRIMRMTAASKVKNRTPIMILIGTPHIMNHFYDSWNDDEFIKFKVTWQEGVKAGILDKTEVDYYKKRMTDVEFDVWFNANFHGGDNVLFESKLVREISVVNKEESPLAGFDYYMGLDVARMGSDESAVVLLRVPKNIPLEDVPITMVNEFCKRKETINVTIGWVKELVLKWKPRLIAVDEIGLGGGVLDMLKEVFGDMVVGVKMMGDERINVYMNLLHLMESKRMMLLKMDKLEYQFRGYTFDSSADGKRHINKSKSAHDDLVDSLAFAAYFLRVESSMMYVLDDNMMKSFDQMLGNYVG
jgi:hypothetical protein